MKHPLSNALEHLYALLVDSLVDDRGIKKSDKVLYLTVALKTTLTGQNIVV